MHFVYDHTDREKSFQGVRLVSAISLLLQMRIYLSLSVLGFMGYVSLSFILKIKLSYFLDHS